MGASFPKVPATAWFAGFQPRLLWVQDPYDGEEPRVSVASDAGILVSFPADVTIYITRQKRF